MEIANQPPEHLRSWLLLNLVITTSPTRRRDILGACGSVEKAVAATENDWPRFSLLRRLGLNDIFAPGSGGAADLGSPAACEAWVARQLDSAARLRATFLTLDDPVYPEQLRTIADPPLVLAVRGGRELPALTSIAVVGARRATHYGLATAGILARDLAFAGIAVVSGGARGIDSAAHAGALEAGGVTIAVLGSGLDVAYPEENAGLFNRIAESGAVVSEFAFGTTPQQRFFPYRNRLIAGLSLGVVVVEGAKGSGSLITAGLAADGGRDVFAVPGPITSPLSEGPHRLIQDGARLVTGVEDILSELPFGALPGPIPQLPGRGGAEGHGAEGADGEARAGAIEAGSIEEAVAGALDAAVGSTADELGASLGLATGDLLGALLELELKGRIKQLPGGRFVRRR